MRVLIVDSDTARGWLWQRHIERLGGQVVLAQGQEGAVDTLQHANVDVIVLNLDVADNSAFAVADYASYRRPSAKVIFVTSSTFFSDGSIFNHSANACAYMRAETAPEDLAAVVEHFSAP